MVWLELILYADFPLAIVATDELADGATLTAYDPIVLPGVDTQLHGASPEVTQRIARSQSAYRLTIRRTDGELWEAHRDAAAILAQLAETCVGQYPDGRLDLVDLFCLDARPLSEGIERLRADSPETTQWVGTRPVSGDAFDVETFGLRKLGNREIHVPAIPSARLGAVCRHLNKVADYLSTTGARIDPGDVASFGWVDVRHIGAEHLAAYPDDPTLCAPRFIREALVDEAALPGVLAVYEPVDDSDEAGFVAGATRAAKIVDQMLEAAKLCGLEKDTDVPRARQTAIVCRRVGEGCQVSARRLPRESPDESGWVAVCADDAHDHDEAESFQELSLRDLVQRAPAVFSLLAMPVGTGITVGEDSELTILLPEQDDGETG